jgi:cohesin complex subunit SA-1/2
MQAASTVRRVFALLFLLTLPAEVFGRGSVLDDVAAEWLGRFNADEYSAIAEFYSFILRCAGCEYTVNSEDVQDPDRYGTVLDDIQGSYQAVGQPRRLI